LNGKPHGICIFENEYLRGIMIYTHGNPFGAPSWHEYKKNGIRRSQEYFSDKNPMGIIRLYFNDKDAINITSTTYKQLAPGFLKGIMNNKGKLGLH